MESTTHSGGFSKENPFSARILENRLLNGPGSAKETRHFVIGLRGSGLSYTAGDSLGVYPRNAPAALEAVLQAGGWEGAEPVTVKGLEGHVPLREALEVHLSLAGPTKRALQAFLERAGYAAERERLDRLMDPARSEELKAFLAEREFVDLLEEFPSARFSAQEFCDLPRKLIPRLYSIASSPVLYPEEVHLTVAVVRYRTNERDRIGVASTFLADRCPAGEAQLPVYIAPSHFGLPEDPETDVIMVGPGTGIAPFRAFLQERQAKGGKGRNWLFFGDQHRATDYLYGEELEAWKADGVLERLDLAFSRDQEHKIYVQDRMREQAAELWGWLEGGACFYVCGDASRMARDVDQALLDVIAGQGGMEERAAKDVVRQMRKEKRYQRDVY